MTALVSGSIRFNTDSSMLEIYDGNAWFDIDSTSPELQTGGTRGIRAGGYSQTDRIEFFNMDTAGNASDFGDMTYASGGSRSFFANSDSHGGIGD